MARDDLTVFWGVASGSTHATFRRHYEGEPEYQDAPTPTHLMLNWRTHNNQVWAAESDAPYESIGDEDLARFDTRVDEQVMERLSKPGPKWMIDSGGAPDTIKTHGGHPDTIHDYLDYLRDPPIKYGDDPVAVDIDRFALRDWPCEPEVQSALGLTVEQLQHRTLVDHINMMDAIEDEHLNAEPVAVLQGWEIEDYLDCIDMYRDHGLVTDTMGIGTLCGRPQVDVIRNTAWRIARNLPNRVSVHGFGVKQNALGEPDVLRIFDSVDTLAWDQHLRQSTKTGIQQPAPGHEYDDWIDWDDDGNPRYTARNLWLNYRAYAQRLADVDPVETPRNVRIVTLDQVADLAGHERPEGQRVDEYTVYKCVCEQVVDPGRPNPLLHYHDYFNLGLDPDTPENVYAPSGEAEPKCRHCEQLELDIHIRRIDQQDQLRIDGPPLAERVEKEAERAVFEQLDLEDEP